MEENCERQEEAARLRQLIEGLPARERKLILLRYGMAGQPPLTQLETAQLLQISRSYVSRLETTSRTIIRLNPTAKSTVPISECSPCDISGMSSSTTTYSMAPAAKLSR